MDGHVLCPHCKKPIPLNDALAHEIKERLNKEALAWRSKKESEFNEKLVAERKKFETEKLELEKEMLIKAQKKAEEALALQLEFYPERHSTVVPS